MKCRSSILCVVTCAVLVPYANGQEIASQVDVQRLVEEQALLLDSNTIIGLSNEMLQRREGPFIQLQVNPRFDFDIDSSPQLQNHQGQLDRKLVLPQVYTRSQFEELFLPREPGRPDFGDDGIRQVIPGLPSEGGFEEPRYDDVRDAFTAECTQSATAYFAKLKELNSLSRFPVGTFDDAIKSLSKNYDEDCLFDVAKAPESLQRVTGVLSIDAKPFCSATIVSDRELLTARHCFFDPYSGLANSYYAGLVTSQVSFTPLSPDHGFSSITAKTARIQDVNQVAYEPYADFFRLRVSGGRFAYFAKIDEFRRGDSAVEPAWLIGSNALLGDLGELVSPIQLVRASAPMSCSVLTITEKGCVYHSCQAGASTSGGGLLVLRSNEPVLIGVHKGHVSRAAGCEPAPPTNLVLNMAARVALTEDGGE